MWQANNRTLESVGNSPPCRTRLHLPQELHYDMIEAVLGTRVLRENALYNVSWYLPLEAKIVTLVLSFQYFLEDCHGLIFIQSLITCSGLEYVKSATVKLL